MALGVRRNTIVQNLHSAGERSRLQQVEPGKVDTHAAVLRPFFLCALEQLQCELFPFVREYLVVCVSGLDCNRQICTAHNDRSAPNDPEIATRDRQRIAIVPLSSDPKQTSDMPSTWRLSSPLITQTARPPHSQTKPRFQPARCACRQRNLTAERPVPAEFVGRWETGPKCTSISFPDQQTCAKESRHCTELLKGC